MNVSRELYCWIVENFVGMIGSSDFIGCFMVDKIDGWIKFDGVICFGSFDFFDFVLDEGNMKV